MSPLAVEHYYTVAELSLLLKLSTKFLRAGISRGDFGEPLYIGRQARVPASGVNRWIEAHQVASIGIAARSPGELKRKLGAREVHRD